MAASSGNRTRAARVAGEHSTTEPTMLSYFKDKIQNLQIIFFDEFKSGNNRVVKANCDQRLKHNSLRDRSQTTLTSFWLFLTFVYSFYLIKVDIFGLPTICTYPPSLVNVLICGRPLAQWPRLHCLHVPWE